MATIATHNRSSVSRGHNLRKEEIVSKESHIDPDGVHETWVDEAPRHAYERIFGQAVREYNEKQSRADRQISDYYNHVRDDAKKHCVYEMIIGVYPADGETVTEEQGRDIMREFVSGWKERNPNLELIGAYYHADEQGRAPHVHLDYVPVAHGYKNGMGTQNGIVKALGEQGFRKQGTATAQILWEKRENECLEKLCNRRGISVEHPQEGKGVKHLHTETYKAQQDFMEVAARAAEEARYAAESAKIFFGDPEQIKAEAREARDSVEALKAQESGLKARIGDLKAQTDKLALNKAEAVTKANKAVTDAHRATATLQGIQKDIKTAESVLEGLQGRILTAQQTRAFKVKRGLFGGEKGAIEGTPEELQSLLNTAAKVEAADKAVQEAQDMRHEAQQIIINREQIINDARDKADNITKKANAEAERIKSSAAEENKALQAEKSNIRNEVERMKTERASLGDTVKREKEALLEDARIEADRLVQEALSEIGQGRVYERVQKMIGIVPQVEVKEAREAMLKSYRALEADMTPEEKQMFREQRTDDLYKSLSAGRRLGVSDMRGWDLISKMKDYAEKLESPRTIEDVERSLTRQSRDRHR